MASRIAARTSASLVRSPAVAALPRCALARGLSSTPPPPAEKANQVLSSLPSNNLITKTGTALLGTGLLATAISQELYVVNEETVVFGGSLILFLYMAKTLRGPYKEWAENHIERIKAILEQSRSQHTQAVRERIEAVEKMKDVVELTKGLYSLSKETANLEAEIFTLRQQVAMTHELKSVLDSWVRFEQQAKEAEQAELAKAVIDRVMKNVSDERIQREILAGAIADIEQLVKNKAI